MKEKKLPAAEIINLVSVILEVEGDEPDEVKREVKDIIKSVEKDNGGKLTPADRKKVINKVYVALQRPAVNVYHTIGCIKGIKQGLNAKGVWYVKV